MLSKMGHILPTRKRGRESAGKITTKVFISLTLMEQVIKSVSQNNHLVSGPNSGRNSGGGQLIKKPCTSLPSKSTLLTKVIEFLTNIAVLDFIELFSISN